MSNLDWASWRLKQDLVDITMAAELAAQQQQLIQAFLTNAARMPEQSRPAELARFQQTLELIKEKTYLLLKPKNEINLEAAAALEQVYAEVLPDLHKIAAEAQA